MFPDTAGRASTLLLARRSGRSGRLILDSDQPPAAEVGSFPKSVCFTTIFPDALSVVALRFEPDRNFEGLRDAGARSARPEALRSYEFGAIRLPVTSTERNRMGAVARGVEHARSSGHLLDLGRISLRFALPR